MHKCAVRTPKPDAFHSAASCDVNGGLWVTKTRRSRRILPFSGSWWFVVVRGGGGVAAVSGGELVVVAADRLVVAD